MDKWLIVFTDSGDTFIDESTEVRDENGIVITAEMIPGAKEALQAIYDAGYLIAMVADGEEQSFTNVYQYHGLDYCFRTRSISEIVGVQKPDAAMFEDAMRKNNLTGADKKRIVMIGNNVKKDVAGANRFGITSILLDWSPRYDMVPRQADEIPDYIVHEPKGLIPLLEKLNGECVESGKSE